MTNSITQEKPKQPWQSGGVLTGFLMLLWALLDFFGIKIEPEVVNAINDPSTIDAIKNADSVTMLLKALGGVAVIYFRVRAKQAIAGGVEGIKDAISQPINWIRRLFKKKT